MNLQTFDFTIKVTSDHIRCGAQGRCESCPVALALKEATNEEWMVTHRKVIHLASGFQIGLPDRVTRWIDGFDQSNSQEIMAENRPIEFDLSLPINIFPAQVQVNCLLAAFVTEAIKKHFLRTSLR